MSKTLLKISEHFTYQELVRSQTAARRGIKNIPNMQQIENARRVAKEIEKLRSAMGGIPVTPSSWFRCKKLNTAIRGSKYSQHMQGEAMDFTISGVSSTEIVEKIIELDLPYHQVIDEFGSWVHFSVAPLDQKPRKQALTAKKIKKWGRLKTVYTPFEGSKK